MLHVDSSSQTDSEAFVTAMESILPQLGSSFSAESLDSIKGSTVMYIDQETFLPVQMECTIEGMDEFFSLNSDWMEELMGLAIEDTQIENLSVRVPDYRFTLSNLTFETEELPVVPEEAYEAIAFQEALAELDPDLGDGTYAIQSTGSAVRISSPENMTASEISSETVTFMDDSGLNTITYAMIPAADLSHLHRFYFVHVHRFPGNVRRGSAVRTGRPKCLHTFWLCGWILAQRRRRQRLLWICTF